MNEALLEAYRLVASGRLEMQRLEGIRELPHFDPDVGDAEIPEEVRRVRRAAGAADFLVFSTPEYIHAMPAVLKNLLEWLVGDRLFYRKPVVILHASRASKFALDSLTEVLATMSATLLGSASVTLSIGSNRTTTGDVLANPEWVDALEGSVSGVMEYFSERDRKPAFKER